jgi:thiosulfate dehydrogenase (quinone) large subunit
MTATMVAPQFWIAILRVVVGIWFLKAVWTKLTIAVAVGVIPYPAVSSRFLAFQPKRVAEFAAGNPIAWYKEFLENSVIPHATVWAMLQAYGEVAVGVGLVLGLLTGFSALVGLFLAVNYGLATQWMSFGQQGFHLLLTTSMIIFVTARAGRAWGLDALILSRAPAGATRWLKLVM